jgi:hypothetical protein
LKVDLFGSGASLGGAIHKSGMPFEPARATVVVVALCHAALELVEATLRESGYRVLATSDVAEALLLAQSVAIDLLIAESLSAFLLEDEIRLLQPSVRFLRISERDEARPGDLMQPFALHELERMVAQVLGG